MPLDDTKIIVVEDDNFMRQMLVDTLKAGGAENVRAFASGVKARAYFQEESVIDAVVVCDIAMPTISGLELHKEISPRQPGLKFIFITALELNLYEQRLLKESGLTLLLKPFTAEELIAAIQEVSHRSP